MDGYESGGYLVFVWTPNGYQLETRHGEPPQVGSEVEDRERRFRATAGFAPICFPRSRRRQAST